MDPTEQQITQLLELSVASGIIKQVKGNQYESIRIAYHPYRSTQKMYDLVKSVSQVWQKLIFKASFDFDLINRVFKHVCCDDPVISHFLSIIKKKNGPKNQKIDRFNLVRNDFFIDVNGLPKLIQYNLDSVSMSSHSENFQKVKKVFDLDNSHNYFQSNPNQNFLNSIDHLYIQQKLKGIVLFVVQKNEKNIIEQRIIQRGLLERKIRSEMITLEETRKLVVDQQNNLKLGDVTVEIVYYRSGYRSQEYVDQWENLKKAMETIELSNAVKIPDAAMKLFNSKRMQTELSKEEVFSKYLTKEESEILKLSVIRQWEFDDMKEEQFREVMKEYENAMDNFVLKPNCEGGGNNLWGEEGYRTLEKATPNERTMYILMEKINTKPIENVLIDGSKHEKTLCDYEVSNFGIIQGRGKELTHNEIIGHLIRIKPIIEKEGGILTGVGSLCAWAREEQQQE